MTTQKLVGKSGYTRTRRKFYPTRDVDDLTLPDPRVTGVLYRAICEIKQDRDFLYPPHSTPLLGSPRRNTADFKGSPLFNVVYLRNGKDRDGTPIGNRRRGLSTCNDLKHTF